MALLRNLHAVEIPLLVAAWTALFLLLPCVGAAIGRAERSR